MNKPSIDKEVLLLLIIIFSLTTPAGIIIGMIIRGVSGLCESVFLSISAGTFLYISASEVITEEFSLSQYKMNKFIGFLVGAIMIALLTLIEYFS